MKKSRKKLITQAIKKAVKQYKETFRLLARDESLKEGKTDTIKSRKGVRK